MVASDVVIWMAVGVCGVLLVAALVLGWMSWRTSLSAQDVLHARLDELGRDMVQGASLGREQIEQLRLAQAEEARRGREELAGGVKMAAEAQREQLEQFRRGLAEMRESGERQAAAMRETLERKLDALREDNARKLDEMRKTVDEKLQGTLEKRLGESFRQVSERLEHVHKALGEMQTLATGVGDLKKVLTNVKTRGTWGEIQLGAILETMLAPGQYAANVAIRPESSERVEFAVKLPGRGGEDASVVWLPIDSKFPKEDYERLITAAERADADAVETAARQIEVSLRNSAQTIASKYINPPATTDFAVLFLPTESLYAEVLRRPGLPEALQREFRVTVAGPTTLAALLNSLQMGFRTLAIQKRSSEVWDVLGSVKAEFQRFGDVLDKVRKKLGEASSVVEQAGIRRRAVERKLRSVEALPGIDDDGTGTPAKGEEIGEEALPAHEDQPSEQ